MKDVKQSSRIGWVTVTFVAALVGANSLVPSFVQAARRGPAHPRRVIHLIYWNMWSGRWETLVKNMVADFNRTHPGIQVKTLAVPSASGDAKLLTAIAAGNPPDVFTEWNPSIGSFAQNHSILSLNRFMKGPYRGMRSWFYPVSLKFSTYRGKLYGLPWTMNDLLLFYNKTMMKQAGLNPHRPPKTMAQLTSDQAKMWKYGKGGSIKQMGFYADTWDALTGVFNVNDVIHGKYNLLTPNAIKEMKFIAEYRKYPFAKVGGFASAFSAAAGGGEDPFDMGKAGFYINGMWEIPQIQQNDPKLQYGVAPLPAPPGGHYGASWINGNYNIIPRGAKYPRAAWTFIAWLAGYHNVRWAASHDPLGGWLPPSPAVTKQPAYKKFVNANPWRKYFVAALANRFDRVTPVTPVEQYFETKMTNAVDGVLEGREKPIAALRHVQTVTNQQLVGTQAP